MRDVLPRLISWDGMGCVSSGLTYQERTPGTMEKGMARLN